MKRTFPLLVAIVLFCSLAVSPLFADVSRKHSFGIGINYGGAQVDWRASDKWMFESRGQQASDTSNNIKTKSSLIGARVYRFLRGDRRFSPFFALEGAAISTKQEDSTYEASGIAAGLLGGLSFKISSHLLLEMDMGPYFVNLKEKRTSVSSSEVDFVGDTSLMFMF